MRSLRTLLASALLAISLSGCAGFLPGKDPTITYHGDVSFSLPERACHKAAADQWREQTSGLADVAFEYDYNTTDLGSVLKHQGLDRLVRWTSTNPIVMEIDKEAADEDGEGPKLLGQAVGKLTNTVRKPVEVRLVMDRLQDPHTCKLATMHEFGHVFGMSHVEIPNKGNILYPSINTAATACLKKDDLLVFSYVNSVPFEGMKPCPDDPLNPITFSSEAVDDHLEN